MPVCWNGRRGGLKNHFAICRRCWEKSWKIKRFSDSVFHLSLASLLHIPPNSGECLSGCKEIYLHICRCVGIGRRGGLKIRWANNSCGFDPRHRHHICSEVSCFGAFFTAQKQRLEHFSETPGELHLQTKPYWKNPNVCKYWK